MADGWLVQPCGSRVDLSLSLGVGEAIVLKKLAGSHGFHKLLDLVSTALFGNKLFLKFETLLNLLFGRFQKTIRKLRFL